MLAKLRQLLDQRGWVLPLICGVIGWLTRTAFAVRYDLHFQGDFAVPYLIAKRALQGDFVLYFWKTDYQGTILNFLTTGLFVILGPSIPLAGMFTAFVWGVAIGLAVHFIRRCFDAPTACVAGLVAAVGVPYLHHYASQPSEAGYTLQILVWFILFIWTWQTSIRGPTISRLGGLGLFLGVCAYANKQVLTSAVTAILACTLTQQGRLLLRQAWRPKLLAAFCLAFVVGYAPEWTNRLTRQSAPAGRPLFQFASPDLMLSNTYWLARSLPAYFDGDPMARTPEGVHYVARNENVESLPRSLADYTGVLAAIITVAGCAAFGVRAFREGNLPRLLLALGPFVNAGLVIAAARSSGCYYGARAYMFSSSILLLLWLGILLARTASRRWWPVAAILGVTVGLSLFHQWQMLQLPDELRDYRTVVRELRAQGDRYGITWYSYGNVLTALSNEETVFATLDIPGYRSYQEAVLAQHRIALVYPTQLGAVPERLRLAGRLWRRDTPVQVCGELSIARLQAEAPVRPSN